MVERVHRTIKRTAMRSGKSVSEAVFWINNTRGMADTSPYELVFCASSRRPGITSDRVEIARPTLKCTSTSTYADIDRNPFSVGDRVYLKTPQGRCDDVWSGPHTVTDIRSNVSVEVGGDGVSRHVSHLRHVPSPTKEPSDSSKTGIDLHVDVELEEQDEESASTESEIVCRRSSRERRNPAWHADYDFS